MPTGPSVRFTGPAAPPSRSGRLASRLRCSLSSLRRLLVPCVHAFLVFGAIVHVRTLAGARLGGFALLGGGENDLVRAGTGASNRQRLVGGQRSRSRAQGSGERKCGIHLVFSYFQRS